MGEVWLEEVAKALGVAWPLPQTRPGREELIHGLKALDAHAGLRALHDELRCLTRVEPEWGADSARKPKTFTLVYPLRPTGSRAMFPWS